MNSIKLIDKYNKFALYGAQVVAYGAYMAIKHLYNRIPECFIVSEPEGNPNDIDNIPVISPDNVSADIFIVISVTELLQDEIVATLVNKGFKNIFRLTAHEEHLLMSEYFDSIGKFPLVTYGKINADIALYETRYHLDKTLKQPPSLQVWELPIQAGAESADYKLFALRDNTGDNISIKNKQYSEASVMYWVWKNAQCSWVGVEHYRRHLLVRPKMLGTDIDVILPLPYMCYPNVQTQFERFVGTDIANAFLAAIKDLNPNDYEYYQKCLQGNYHYAYNLISAKKEVYSDYCEWAFGITDYLEKLRIDNIGNARKLGYIMEQLTSIYFVANLKHLNIKHAEKAIYI